MQSTLRGLILFACAAAVQAQMQPPATPQQAAGLEADWDIAPVLQEIGDHALRLLPPLDQANTKSWLEKGASETYVAQVQSSKEQARAIADEAKALSHNPEVLSSALQVLFRIQGLETMLGSVAEALRKYQSPADAQALIALSAENGANRDRLQRYIVNLAAQREKEYQVMDKEAQRCRGMLTAPVISGRKK